MTDKIEIFEDSVIQHGCSNDRIYLIKIAPQDPIVLIDYAQDLASSHGYSKIFAKVPESQLEQFIGKGFIEEARVPKFFSGHEDGYFLGLYRSESRRRESKKEVLEDIIAVAQNKALETAPVPVLESDFKYRIMQKNDVEQMAVVYGKVFASYPFPIEDPNYLMKTMDEDVVYHGVWHNDELVALSSAEIDFEHSNVEMTDFATLPEYRSHGLASYLLNKMEKDVQSSGILTAYTIARAYSYGMNITFAKHGYKFAGSLTNNTQIFGELESMNVWYRPL
ncbi:MAG: putative beta-lysine N-acetyltransferase [Thermodesulfobacteriota bacterium]|nr:putative beta-lysine N-acetyltransferase [Thermodesulfobacteriota bacterium]